MTDIFNLDNRIALITGSSGGIGLRLAEGLATHGATIVLNGRDAARLERAYARLAAQYPQRVHQRGFDVTDATAVERHVAEIEATIGEIDILINNAGVQHREPLLDIGLDDWDRVLALDLTAPFLVGRTVARGMVERGRGKIVNIASVQSELARPGIGAYTAAKGGVRNLTRAMAAEWARHGLQVNALAPGYFDTELTAALVADPEFTAWIAGRTPAGRWGHLDDLVGPVVWLSSAGSDFVNGQTIYVDGGMTTVI